MARKEQQYWTLYMFIEKKYGVYLCEEEFRKLPAEKQREYFNDYQKFIRYNTKGGKK